MTERAPRQPMLLDEFLAWGGDGTDARHELADGTITAMAPPGIPHGTIVANATALIHAALRSRRPCRPANEAGIAIDERTCWQADIAVTCGPPAPVAVDPLLVVEVLSPGTRAHDLGRKLPDYKTLPSVREIWLIDGQNRWVQAWWRGDDGAWTARDHVGGGDFPSRVLDRPVPLDELYADSGLERPA